MLQEWSLIAKMHTYKKLTFYYYLLLNNMIERNIFNFQILNVFIQFHQLSWLNMTVLVHTEDNYASRKVLLS